METRYKFLYTNGEKIKSHYGDFTWEIGKQYSITNGNNLEMCKHGFHCSQYIQEALNWIQGDVLAQVEVDGDNIIGETKECWEKMRIIKTWEWTPEISIKLAIYAAEMVLPIYEKEYPGDDRPRKAIEAAKAYLNNPCKGTAHAAADAAAGADDAAYAAAYAADDAADAAAAAAASAASAAADAAAYSAGPA